MKILSYFITIVAEVIFILLYFKIADRYNIIDKPNERSSHSYITIRGGGIIFPLTVILWHLIYGIENSYIVFALFILAFVSFIDDIKTLSSKIRMLVHIGVMTILFFALKVFDLPWYYILIIYLLSIGWINAFNFMDGINGMMAFYSLLALSTFLFLSGKVEFVSSELIIVLILSILVFMFFNVRKRAKTFAGDVGSMSMAFILAWLMLTLILKTNRFEYILLFALYGIDSAFTIFFRLIKGENIFEAHRSHLYQYLCNELNWPHVRISLAYIVAQLVVNVITIFLILNDKMTMFIFIILLIGLSCAYIIVRSIVLNKINSRSLK